MTTLAHITLSEFQTLLRGTQLPTETRLTVTFEDERSAMAIMQRQKALEAMRKLRGSGNGNLLRVLLQDREREKTL
jgi:hypothetical protein